MMWVRKKWRYYENGDIYRSVNANWKNFLHTHVTAMTKIREAFFFSSEKQTKIQGNFLPCTWLYHNLITSAET